MVGARGFEPPTPTTPLFCAHILTIKHRQIPHSYAVFASPETQKGRGIRKKPASIVTMRQCAQLGFYSGNLPLVRYGLGDCEGPRAVTGSGLNAYALPAASGQ